MNCNTLAPPLKTSLRKWQLVFSRYYRRDTSLLVLLFALVLGEWAASFSAFQSWEFIVLLALATIYSKLSFSRKLWIRYTIPFLLCGVGYFDTLSRFPRASVAHEIVTKTCVPNEKSAGGRGLLCEIEGRVLGPVERRPLHALKFVLLSETTRGTAKFLLTAPDLPWLESAQISEGDELRIKTRLRLLSDGKPAPFTYQGLLFRRGFSGVGPVLEVSRFVKDQQSETWQDRLLDGLEQQYEYSDALVALLTMTLGYKDLPSEQLTLLFRETGTMHLLVISGFQVGLLYYLALRLFLVLIRQFPAIITFLPGQTIAAIFAYISSSAYAIATGVALPTARALAAISIISFAELCGRKGQAVRNTLLALGVVLILWPGSLFEPGCQLTFLAILGLLVGNSLLLLLREGWGRNETKWAEKLIAPNRASRFFYSIAAPLVYCSTAWLYTLPVQLQWFSSFALAAPLFNFLLIAAFSFCFTSCAAVSLLLHTISFPGASAAMQLNLSFGKVLLNLLWLLREKVSGTWLGYRLVSAEEAHLFAQISAIAGLLLLSVLFIVSFLRRVRLYAPQRMQRAGGE